MQVRTTFYAKLKPTDKEKLKFRVEVEDGMRHGSFEEFWGDGSHRVKCFYERDFLHGEYKRFFNNGKLAKHDFYIKGKRHMTSRELQMITPDEKVFLTLRTGARWL